MAGRSAITRESVLQLIRQKEAIEAEIKTYHDVLKSQKNVGMQESLVDPEGYPRNDIDICTVRHARHEIICLQNDHKSIMHQIEKAIHEVHAKDKEDGLVTSDLSVARASNELLEPFARVESISPRSPAEEAGLLVNDLILEFGSVNPKNFASIQNIAGVVQHSIGRTVNITVRREDANIHLGLIPKQWSGKGLLGCSIVPITH